METAAVAAVAVAIKLVLQPLRPKLIQLLLEQAVQEAAIASSKEQMEIIPRLALLLPRQVVEEAVLLVSLPG